MNQKYEALFQSFDFPCGIKVNNRVVMAPMTTWSGNDDGTISLKSKSKKGTEGRDLIFRAPTFRAPEADVISQLEKMRKGEHNKLDEKIAKAVETTDSHELIDAEYDKRIADVSSRVEEGQVLTSLINTPQYKSMINAAKRGDSEALQAARNRVDTMLQGENWLHSRDSNHLYSGCGSLTLSRG